MIAALVLMAAAAPAAPAAPPQGSDDAAEPVAAQQVADDQRAAEMWAQAIARMQPARPLDERVAGVASGQHLGVPSQGTVA